ncbi:maleylpyruvate isomerase family mycothiol-dependent enzyme [Acrocarpospora sp. B8E8]|uniref:maleylpyruvate isomerase family mycothiol-dependent enzyme n=1 Tax=Acrocarpospora sp. B8E8 TaxID=3153572 RepID=UPI00325EFF56
MTDLTDQTIKALRSEFDELAALVRGFDEEDLARQSGAAEWDVSQVLSHLGSGAEINLAALEGAVRGAGAPGMEFIQGVWGRWDAMSRVQRAEGFVGANEALVRRFEELDPQTRGDVRVHLWFPTEPVDVASFGAMRLSEVAHHTWDVKVAVDPGATLNPETVGLLVDRVGSVVGFAGKPAGLGGGQATVAVHITSPERSFGLDIREAVAIVDVPDAPDAVLTAPAEWWLRLVVGRHAPERTPAAVEVTGAVTLDDLRRVFPGY